MCLNQKNLLEVERGSPCVFPDENHYIGYNVFKPKKTYWKFKGARLECFLMKTILMNMVSFNQQISSSAMKVEPRYLLLTLLNTVCVNDVFTIYTIYTAYTDFATKAACTASNASTAFIAFIAYTAGTACTAYTAVQGCIGQY